MFRICALSLLFSLPASADVLSGTIRVVDADTFDIGGPVNVRLIGIDAAEGGQTCVDTSGATVACGEIATNGVRSLFEGRQAECTVRDYDRYDRALAVCRIDGVDANAEIVRRGLARTYRDDRTYIAQQREAERATRGLWAYDMEDPALWRAQQRQARVEDFAPSGACAIKGNISGNGRIYHLPTGQDYGRTRIDESKGERWFCTEGDARAAGWRPANR